jgi:hypothetical protein
MGGVADFSNKQSGIPKPGPTNFEVRGNFRSNNANLPPNIHGQNALGQASN